LIDNLDSRILTRLTFASLKTSTAGGVTREYFQLLTAQLFDVNTGMWSTRFENGNTTWFNSDCSWNDEGYYLSGILVGLAVYNSVLLDVNFPQAVYRKLLAQPLGLEDMVDEEIKRGLQQLLDYEGDDVEEVFCLTFDVNWVDLGQEKRKELKPNGCDVPVTADNKEEYVMLYVKWLLVESIYPQYESFEAGFTRVMENSTLDLLRPEELELLVVGIPQLDFDALEKNTEYEGGYSSDSEVVINFWRFVRHASSETQLNLMKFITGSTRAPIGGLGKMNFKIQRAGPDSANLPTSHTCFNTLLLPDYGNNYEKLEDRLGRAILECEGFGLQ
jgi:ubiquitin-protein ligase E3 A